MEYPKKLKIGGHWIKVLYPYHFRDTDNLDALADVALKEIKINDTDKTGNKVAKSFEIVGFIHEILHHIDIQSGHQVFAKNEPAIEGISEGIFQVLVDNGFLKIEEE